VLRTKWSQDTEKISPGTGTYLHSKDGIGTPVVSFIGNCNSGKTTLLEQVIRELKLREYRVAVIKHSHHDIDIDRPGKDSWRYAQAGVDIVAISSPKKMAFIDYTAIEPSLAQIEQLFSGKVDIVLTEGYKSDRTAKIVVLGAEEEPSGHEEEILATVSAQVTPSELPQFDSNDIANIVNLIVAQIGEKSRINK
jgi:molybdopterin-guanine dinucleotide biosynthesis protein B